MGFRNPRTQNAEPNLDRHISHPRDGGGRLRHGGAALKCREIDLNFPNSASSLPVSASVSAADIQAAAASTTAAAGAAMDSLGGGRKTEIVMAQPEAPVMVDHEFVDEDLIFDLPNVLASMAQGMLMGFIDDDDYIWN